MYNLCMTKADKILIVCLMVISIFLVVPILGGYEASESAVVTVKQKEVLRIDLSKDDLYQVEGVLGPVKIEVKDRKVRVTQENSPHHVCSKQGFVSSANTPIVCLPNETVVQIESNSNTKEDTVIQ